MSFDPALEAPIPLMQVPALLPWLPKRRGGRPLHYTTLYRWQADGLRGRKLETIQFGGTLCTSEAAIKRFLNLLSASKPEVALA